jgi:hypothetical protein
MFKNLKTSTKLLILSVNFVVAVGVALLGGNARSHQGK